MGASVQSRIATGEHQGQRVRRVGSFGLGGEQVRAVGRLCAEWGGFSLHAAVRVGARQRWRNGEKQLHEKRQQKLEKLCRYVMRGAVAENRLQREENGEISYLLKTPWSDGTKAVQFTPLEFVDRAAIAIEAKSCSLGTAAAGAPDSVSGGVCPQPLVARSSGARAEHKPGRRWSGQRTLAGAADELG